MNIFIADNAESLAKQVADGLVQKIGTLSSTLLCPASGDTPAGLYRELVARAKKGSLDIHGWWFVGLDEWGGMNGDDEGSCRWHLDRQLFEPLGVGKERIQFFDGRAVDLDQECIATED